MKKNFFYKNILILFFAICFIFSLSYIKENFISSKNELTFQPFDINTAVDQPRLLLEDQTLLTRDGTYIFSSMDNLGMSGSKIEIAKADGSFRKQVTYSDSISYYSTPILNNDETKFAYFKVFPMEIWIYNLITNTEEIVYSETERGDQRNIFNPRIGYGGKVLDVYWDEEDNLRFKNISVLPHQEYALNIKTKEIELVPNAREDIAGINLFDDNFEIINYSQRSADWSEEQLGACENETMGSAGCAVTAITMLLNHYGYKLTPKDVNEKLRENSDIGYIGCAIRWNMVPNLANDGKLVLKLVGFNKYDLDRVDYELSLGNPVVAGFNSVNFIDIPHWVLITGKDANGEYLTNDPWTGEQKSLSYFGSKFDHMIVYERI